MARLWRAAGDDVIATTRRENPTLEMIDTGAFRRRADVTQPDNTQVAAIRSCVERSADRVAALLRRLRSSVTSVDIEQVYAQGCRMCSAALPVVRSTRVIYISTTGVYGPAGGEWVDEQTLPAPERDGGKASLAAEQVLAAHPIGKRSIILRLAGIYGPDRIPYIDKLRAGEPLACRVRVGSISSMSTTRRRLS